jgi:hypothetical protein
MRVEFLGIGVWDDGILKHCFIERGTNKKGGGSLTAVIGVRGHGTTIFGTTFGNDDRRALITIAKIDVKLSRMRD